MNLRLVESGQGLNCYYSGTSSVRIEKRLHLDYEKAKSLLMSLMYFGIPSLSLFKIVAIFWYNGGSSFVKPKSDF